MSDHNHHHHHHDRGRDAHDDDDDDAECPGGHDERGGEGSVHHPMIPVPEALRIVLRESALSVVLNSPGGGGVGPGPVPVPGADALGLTSDCADCVGRVLAEDAVMPEPGYPPYDASVMDGYAARSADLREAAAAGGGKVEGEAGGGGGGGGGPWTHRIAGRLFAGDSMAPPAASSSPPAASAIAQQPTMSSVSASYSYSYGEGEGEDTDEEGVPFDERRDRIEAKRSRDGGSYRSPRRGFHGASVARSLPYDERHVRDLKELAREEGGGGGGGGGEAETSGDAPPEADAGAAPSYLPDCVYVTTGAPVPSPYDCVVPIEEVTVSPCGRFLRVDASPHKFKAGKWVRKVGCDIPPGEMVLERGTVLEPAHVGLLAQVGAGTAVVTAVPTVGVLSTGNEILRPGEGTGGAGAEEAAKAGLIPDANRPMLLSMLSTYRNSQPVDLGIVSDDDPDAVAAALVSAFADEGCDVVVTTGGISVGEKDIMERVLVEGLGATVHFGRLHMKPGKPTTFFTLGAPDAPPAADPRSSRPPGDDGSSSSTFTPRSRGTADADDGAPTDAAEEDGGGAAPPPPPGRVRRRLVFCLPGNPVSAAVCAQLLVRPCLDLLHSGVAASSLASRSLGIVRADRERLLDEMVGRAAVHPEVFAALSRPVKLDAERPEYHRVTLAYLPPKGGRGGGKYVATSTGAQRSSRLMSMCGADGLMVLPRGTPDKMTAGEGGEAYPVLLLRAGGGGIKVSDSIHARMMPRGGDGTITVRVVHVVGGEGSDDTSDSVVERVAEALEGSEAGSGTFSVGKPITADLGSASGDGAEELAGLARSLARGDGGGSAGGVVIVAVCGASLPYPASLDAASALRSAMTGEADALALRARSAAASSDGRAALFEAVAGRVDGGDGDDGGDGGAAVALLLSEAGMGAALRSVGGLLAHAASVGRGTESRGGGGKEKRGHGHGHGHGHHHRGHSHSHHH